MAFDPRLDQLRANLTATTDDTDPRLARLRALKRAQGEVTPGEKATAGALFGAGKGELAASAMPTDTSTIPSMADRLGITDPVGVGKQLVASLPDQAAMSAGGLAGLLSFAARTSTGTPAPFAVDLAREDAHRIADPVFEKTNEVFGQPTTALGTVARMVGPTPFLGAAGRALRTASIARQTGRDVGRIAEAMDLAKTADETEVADMVARNNARMAEAKQVDELLSPKSEMGELLRQADRQTRDAQATKRAREAEAPAARQAAIDEPRSAIGQTLADFDRQMGEVAARVEGRRKGKPSAVGLNPDAARIEATRARAAYGSERAAERIATDVAEGSGEFAQGSGIPSSEARLGAVRQPARAWVDIRGQPVMDEFSVHRLLYPFRHPKAEHFHVLLLDDEGRVASHTMETSGAINSVQMHRDLAYRIAARAKRLGVTRVILAHNHPSGNPAPSVPDAAFTRSIHDRLQPQGIMLEGHYVIDHDRGTMIRGDASGSTEVTFHPGHGPGAGAADWTKAMGDRVQGPEDVHRLVSQVRPSGVRMDVLYLSSDSRAVALEPHRLGAAPNLATWLPQRLRAHGASKAILVVADEHARRRLAGMVLQDPALRDVYDVYNFGDRHFSSEVVSHAHPEAPTRYSRRLFEAHETPAPASGVSQPELPLGRPGARYPALQSGAEATQEVSVLGPGQPLNNSQAGGALVRTLPAVAGGLGAGAYGAATADEGESRIGRAATYGLTGAIGGYLLGRAAESAVRRRALPPFQNASADPDVAAVLSISAPPRQPVRRSPLQAAWSEAEKTYQSLVDDVYGVRKFGRKVGGSEALSEEVSRARGWRGFADELIGLRAAPQQSILGRLPSLRKTIEASRRVEADVVALTRAERAIELDDAGMGWKLEGSATRQQAEATVRKLSARHEVRGAADQLRQFYEYLYDLRRQNGLVSDAEYAATKAKHQRYVPFVRNFGQEALGATPGTQLSNRATGVRRMEEGLASAAIVDPFEQAVRDAYSTARDVSRQRAWNLIADITENHPAEAAPFVRDLGTAPPNPRDLASGLVIQAIRNGERRYYGIADEGMYNALSSVAPETRDLAHKILRAPKEVLRSLVTIVPSFGVANAERDAFFSSLSYALPMKQAAAGAVVGAGVGAALDPADRTRGALRGAAVGLGAGAMAPHLGRIGRAMGSIVGNDDFYQAWRREGGAGTGYFLERHSDAAKVVEQLRKDGVSPADILKPRTWWDALETLNRFVEEAPRVAKFRSELEAGAPGGTAAAASRNVSVDFGRHGGGRVAQLGRETAAFWNPKVQGWDRLYHVFKSPKAYAVGVATMTAPTIALWSINKDDPEYWRRPLYERNAFWLIPYGKDEQGVTKFHRVMKPFEPGMVFASIPERMLDYAYQRRQELAQGPGTPIGGAGERAKDAARQIAGSTVEGVVPIPTAVLPLLETSIGKQGYSFFRGRPVVDDALVQRPKREQIDARTSDVAIALSRAAEAVSGGLAQPSPRKVQHVIEGYTGTAGQAAMRAADAAARKVGIDQRPEIPSRDRSQWARFSTQDAGFNTDDIQTMFRRFEEANQHVEQVKSLARQGDRAGALAYAKEHEREFAVARVLAPAVTKYRKLAQARRAIEADRGLSPSEKAEKIRGLGLLASELVRRALQVRLPDQANAR